MRPAETAPSSAASASRQTGVWMLLIGVLGIVLASLLFGRVLDQVLPKANLPVFSAIKMDLLATERSGQTVHLSGLQGKVFTCAYIYTVCPHGCAAVMGQMLKLHKQFGTRPDFHQVSVAVAPERDTPQFLRNYAEGLALTANDPWWFLTGDQKQLWSFMDNALKLAPAKPIPPDERLNPLDVYEHDLRIVLIDRKGQVRGYYAVFHPQAEVAQVMCNKLQRDTRTLLDHPEL